jgi:hypothetical protein
MSGRGFRMSGNEFRRCQIHQNPSKLMGLGRKWGFGLILGWKRVGDIQLGCLPNGSEAAPGSFQAGLSSSGVALGSFRPEPDILGTANNSGHPRLDGIKV